MAFSKSLLFKGLGGCTVCVGSVAVALTQKDKISALFSPSSKAKIGRVGLECGETLEDGSVCSIKVKEGGGKLLVKRGDSNSFEVTNLGSGTIKFFNDTTHEEGFRFSIEGSDIVGSGTGGNKMEEFESYEIRYGGEGDEEALKDKYYLSLKTNVRGGMKRALGLPCELPTDASVNCPISSAGIGNISFDGGTATISGNVTLTISTDSAENEYPLGYRFSFKNTGDSDVTLRYGEKTVTLKKNSPVDFKIKKEGSSLSLEKAWTLEELAEKVGIKKESSGDYWVVERDHETLNIKQDTNKDIQRKRQSNQTGKIKVYVDQEDYNEGLKFVVEKGDINLAHKSGSTVKVLGQFETYEISKDADGKWYLTRKTRNEEKVKSSLGLPCSLPEGNGSSVCDINAGNIGQINFEGGKASLEGTPKLTITGGNSRYSYPFGYKFAFTSKGTGNTSITVNGTKTDLKEGLVIDFKIKSSGTDNSTLTLEKSWTPDSLIEQTGFKRNGSNDSWTPGSSNVSIKQGTNKSDNVTAQGNQSAKIRVYEGVPGYNQGFKFVVEDGDTDLTGGAGIGKLTKYETYEVSVDNTDKQWYFTRKLNSSDSIKEILGLPKTCSIPTAQACSLGASDLNGIKFKDKREGGTVSITEGSGTINLNIAKVSGGSDFPVGYKFTFSSDQYGFTIPKSGGGDITIKKGTNTEFKIKEGQKNNLTLERAWDVAGLGKKVKLNCSNNSCTFGDKINVFDGDNSYVNDAQVTEASNKTLSYQEGVEGYNQGIKFYVGGEDICLQNGTSGSLTKISKSGDGGATYQIMEKTVEGSNRWYLVKK